MSLDHYGCVRCKKYLLDHPTRCPCGHLLCGPCFDDYSYNVFDSSFECNKCGEEIFLEECLEDYAVLNDLRKCVLQCTLPGCPWKGSYTAFRKHIQVCKYAQIRCSYWQYGCLAKLIPEEVEDHEESCLFKPEECELCGKPDQHPGVINNDVCKCSSSSSS